MLFFAETFSANEGPSIYIEVDKEKLFNLEHDSYQNSLLYVL